MTYSRNQRRKRLKRERPGPSTKVFKKKKEKELTKRLERRRARPQTPPPEKRKVGRNDPCSCQSGQKYKRCCYLGPDAALSIEKFLKKLGESKYAKSTS